jgi:TPR repeat protein
MGDKAVSRKPLGVPAGYAPNDGEPRIREAPVSPVRVNFQQDNWAQPSNVDIEHMQPRAAHINLTDRTRHREPGFTTAPSSPQGPDFFGEGSPQIPQPTAFASSSSTVIPRRQPPQSPPAFEDAGHRPSTTSDDYETPTITSPISPADRIKQQELYRNSRESDDTASTQQQASTESSAATSASSVSGINENADCQPPDDSPGSSVIEGQGPGLQSVPQFQYHHQQQPHPRVNSIPNEARTASSPDLTDGVGNPRRHLTPTSQYFRRSSLPRPQSSYSVHSDLAPRGRSPGLMPGGSHLRAPSVQSRKSPDVRLSTYAELLNVPYPQQAPAPLTLDNSNLRTVVGNNASLLSTQKTLEMYRQNVKKTNDLSIQYSFAVFLISTAQEQGLDVTDPKGRKNSPQPLRDHDSPIIEATVTSPYELVREARQILQRLSSSGYPFAQYYLADGYASGLFNKGKEDYNSAFPLFVLAAKHGHAESAYRTALCYEFGWGCRRDAVKAVQFLRSAASKRHPGAMTRLGKACLSGDLGEKRYREGIKWMKLATEAADHQYNAAPYQLGCLYETGYGDDIFADEHYAAELFTMAADLGHPEANFRMGDAYEHGRLQCPRDPSLSVHFYTGAAERGHAAAMMGLCAWYMVGAPPILDRDEEEAYEWASKSAKLGESSLG